MMDIPPVQTPVLPPALPQDAAKTVPQVQAQAATPIVQRAVDPAPRSERGQQSRSNGDKAKGGQTGGQGGGKSGGGTVNIRV